MADASGITEPGLQADSHFLQTWGIILAAGSGSRMGAALGGMPKQFLLWHERPLYWHCALTMSRSACLHGLVFVVPKEFVDEERERITKLARLDNLGLPWRLVAGGARRQDSSKRGLLAVPKACKRVLIQDAARPLATAALMRRVAESVTENCPCVVPGIAVTDTIKVVNGQNYVCGSLARAELAAAQTPQGFWKEALQQAMSIDEAVTDDAMLMEKSGFTALVVPGEPGNVKITTANDLSLLEKEGSKMLPCAGFGYDAHRIGCGRPLIIGGVAIPCGLEVIAHSDGDILLHALMDSLLGLACLGDIGRHFPDSDPRYSGISSAVLLDNVLELVAKARVRLCHADLTVVAQKPKLAPYAEEIRGNVARLLNLPESCVNFKATTEEKLGFTGACEGIKAYALTSGLKPKTA